MVLKQPGYFTLLGNFSLQSICLVKITVWFNKSSIMIHICLKMDIFVKSDVVVFTK